MNVNKTNIFYCSFYCAALLMIGSTLLKMAYLLEKKVEINKKSLTNYIISCIIAIYAVGAHLKFPFVREDAGSSGI